MPAPPAARPQPRLQRFVEFLEGDALGDHAVDLASDVLQDVDSHRLGGGERPEVLGGVRVLPAKGDVETLLPEMLDRLTGRDVEELRL